MAKPTIGDSIAFTGPPIELMTTNRPLYDFLLMIYDHIYGLGGNSGSLSSENMGSISADHVTGVVADHTTAISVTAYQHHGAGQHANLDQAPIQDDLVGTVPTSTVIINNEAE